MAIGAEDAGAATGAAAAGAETTGAATGVAGAGAVTAADAGAGAGTDAAAGAAIGAGAVAGASWASAALLRAKAETNKIDFIMIVSFKYGNVCLMVGCKSGTANSAAPSKMRAERIGVTLSFGHVTVMIQLLANRQFGDRRVRRSQSMLFETW